MTDYPSALPETGRPAEQLLADITTGRGDDLDWKSGRAFSLVYNAADAELERVQHGVAELFLHDNALNPMAYPSLRAMEGSVIAMAADLFGTDARSGALTSGGTESIFCAVQVARDYAREVLGKPEPTILLPSTAHPAFDKAAKYLDIEVIRVAVGADGRADVAATAVAVDDRTAMIVGSTPCYPYGVIDDITGLAALAVDAGILCHVDACLGGWLLPFWEAIGEPVPPWTFAVEGVTSLSADIHKYGYGYKGASVVMYCNRSLLKFQFFSFDDWPGGFYGSATPAGTRPAPPIAGAWATLVNLGRDGLLAKAADVLAATKRFVAFVDATDGIEVLRRPEMSVVLFGATDPQNNAPLAAALHGQGWKVDVQQEGLHLMMSPGHLAVLPDFEAAIVSALASISSNGVPASPPAPQSGAGEPARYADRAI